MRSVAATAASRFRRARPGRPYLNAIVSPCSVTLSRPSTACGRLGEDRGVRRAASAPRTPAATVEDGQLDAALAREPREPLLRAEDLPLGRDDAAVLAGVGVADHHLEPVARAPVEELGRERLGAAEVVDRLEQRDDGHVEACLRGERLGEEDVVGRAGHRDDQRVDRLGPRRRWSAAASASTSRVASGSWRSWRACRRRSSAGPVRPNRSRRRRSAASPPSAIRDPPWARRLASTRSSSARSSSADAYSSAPEPLPDRRQPPPVRLGRVALRRAARRLRPRRRRRRACSTCPTRLRAHGRRAGGARGRAQSRARPPRAPSRRRRSGCRRGHRRSTCRTGAGSPEGGRARWRGGRQPRPRGCPRGTTAPAGSRRRRAGAASGPRRSARGW